MALRSLPPPIRAAFKTPAVPVEELVCVATRSEPTSGGTGDLVDIDNRGDAGVEGKVAAIVAAALDTVFTGSFIGSFRGAFIGSFIGSFRGSFAIDGIVTLLFLNGDFPILEGFIDTSSIEFAEFIVFIERGADLAFTKLAADLAFIGIGADLAFIELANTGELAATIDVVGERVFNLFLGV